MRKLHVASGHDHYISHNSRSMKLVSSRNSQKLSQDSESLNNAVGQVSALPLEDPTLKPENAYVIHGTTYPRNIQLVAPPIYKFASAAQDQPSTSGGGSASAAPGGVAASAAPAAGSKCEGPVRHGDTPLCVAKKALAQALQAESDVATVDSAAALGRRRAGQLQDWERSEHGKLSGAMDREFDRIGRALDEEGRQIGDAERQTVAGDQEAQLKTDLARHREQADFASVRRRVADIAKEAALVSKMSGPPGPRGPPVPDPPVAPAPRPSSALQPFSR